jgi:cytidylate kinase
MYDAFQVRVSSLPTLWFDEGIVASAGAVQIERRTAVAARVVCISRAIGACADEIADEVAKELGFQRVDEEIVAQAAARHQNLKPADVADVERRRSIVARVLDDMGRSGGIGGYVPDPGVVPHRSDDLRSLIQDAVIDRAAQGNVVIVAHAASYALDKRDDVLRVLVTGSPSVRASRIAAAETMSTSDAARAIRKSDAARADYLKRFYEIKRESPEHYDLVVSTDVLTPSQSADLVVQAARSIRT